MSARVASLRPVVEQLRKRNVECNANDHFFEVSSQARYSSEISGRAGKVLGCLGFFEFFTEYVSNCVSKAFTLL